MAGGESRKRELRSLQERTRTRTKRQGRMKVDNDDDGGDDDDTQRAVEPDGRTHLRGFDDGTMG